MLLVVCCVLIIGCVLCVVCCALCVVRCLMFADYVSCVSCGLFEVCWLLFVA